MRKQGATWWSSRFLRSLERLGLASRLRAGRQYLKKGRVSQLQVEAGGVTSVVEGDREYHCRIDFEPLLDFEWEESLERLALQDLSAAALLTTGRLPPHIDDFFRPSGRRLLPVKPQELEFHCTCYDEEKVCEHLAATAFLFAERLDLDPWLLFLVRGRSAEEVRRSLQDLWNRDLPAEDGEEIPLVGPSEERSALTADVDRFWNGFPLDGETELSPEPTPPGMTAERLGVPEPRIEEKPWQGLLSEIYAAVATRAEKRLSG